MKSLFLFSTLFAASVLGLSLDRLFNRYAGTFDHTMEVDEMGKWVMHFDKDGDGNVTKLEFDRTWKSEDLGDEEHAPFYFLELDRVADEVLNYEDVPHIFRLFDEDGNGHITNKEFRFNWEGLFDN